MSSGACIALRCGRMLDDVSFTWFSLKAGRSRWLCTPCGVRVRFVDVWVPFSHEAWVLHRCGLQLVPTAPWDRSTSPWHVRMRVLATRHVSINTASKVNRTSKNVQKQRGEERKARGVFSLDREGLGFGPWRSYEGSLVRPRGSNRTSFRTPSRLTPPSILTRPASSRNVHERGRGFPPPRPGSSSSSSPFGSISPLSSPFAPTYRVAGSVDRRGRTLARPPEHVWLGCGALVRDTVCVGAAPPCPTSRCTCVSVTVGVCRKVGGADRGRRNMTMVWGAHARGTWKRGMSWNVVGTKKHGHSKGRVEKVRATFTRDLYLGDRGVEVCRLQADILGMEPSGHFDLETQQKLQTWQVQNQVEPTGRFGPLSRMLVEEQLQILVEQAKKVAEEESNLMEAVEMTTQSSTNATSAAVTTTATDSATTATAESIGESLRPPSPPGGDHGFPLIMGLLASTVLAALSNRETWTSKRTGVLTQNWNTDVGRQLRKLVAKPNKKFFFLKDGKMLPGRVLVETMDQLPMGTVAEGGVHQHVVSMSAEGMTLPQRDSAKQELRAWEENQSLVVNGLESGGLRKEGGMQQYASSERSETYNLKDRMERTRRRRHAQSWQVQEQGVKLSQMEDDFRQGWRQSSPKQARRQFSR